MVAVGCSLGMSFAAVPALPHLLSGDGVCRHDTTRRSCGSLVIPASAAIAVRFDANVAPGLPWRFEPETPGSSRLRTGETATVYFKVTNQSRITRPLRTRSYNVTPDVAGLYFDKIACFCFTQQHLGRARDRGNGRSCSSSIRTLEEGRDHERASIR